MSATVIENIGLLATPMGFAARSDREQGEIRLLQDAYLCYEDGVITAVGTGKAPAADQQQAKVNLAGRRILLAEDMDVNAEIMEMVLQMREMQADRAENGEVAVELFRSHPEGYYDAVLMDMRMPKMDGLEATRAIRSMNRPDAASIPIIALTANAFDEDVQRSMQAGLNAHLSKPVQPELLFETLESLIKN
jgi:CheY-like chemotaxis protein